MGKQMSKQSNRINIGIIGCGAISGYHINALRLIPEANLTAFCDREKGKADAAAGPESDLFTDYRELLNRDELDIVFILTPNYLHSEMAVAAAEAGKHVFVQKPMARTPAECDEMIAAARDKGVKLFQSFMHRYFAECLWVREFLGNGGLGDIHMIRIRNSIPGSSYSTWQFDSEKCGNGGVMIDIGVHGVDLISHMVGEIESLVHAAGGRNYKERTVLGKKVSPDNEDWALASYTLKNGAVVSHEMSWTQRSQCNRFWVEIHGSRGSIFLRSGYGPLAVSGIVFDSSQDLVFPVLDIKPLGYRQHREVIDCLLEDKEPLCTGEDGRRAVSFINDMYELIHSKT